MKRQKLITNGYHIPYNPKLKERSRIFRKNMTYPEKRLWFGFLRTQEVTFLRQKPLDNYIVDFYCPSHKLVIEIDGESHFSNKGEIYDKERTAVLNGYNLQVFRFTNKDIMENFEGVCLEIKELLQKSP